MALVTPEDTLPRRQLSGTDLVGVYSECMKAERPQSSTDWTLKNEASCFYTLWGPQCGVCQVFKPKLELLMTQQHLDVEIHRWETLSRSPTHQSLGSTPGKNSIPVRCTNSS